MRVARLLTSAGLLYAVEREGEYVEIEGSPREFSQLLAGVRTTDKRIDGELTAPLSPGKIVALGRNYPHGVDRAVRERPMAPLVLGKFPSSVVGPGIPIRFDPSDAGRVDWEVELAVVIGIPARDVSPGGAMRHVWGYTVANDVSAHGMADADGEWTRGKSLDTFCPLGPVMVTADEITDPQALALGTKVNGADAQRSSTSQMVFGVAELVAYCSRWFTLDPGDLLLTGTPARCGQLAPPGRGLLDGDLVEAWVERIGTLSNPVVTGR